MFLGAGVSTPLFYAEALSEEPLAGIVASLAAVLGQILIAAYGVWKCYHANGGRSGQRFAETFIAIGWVVSLRVFLVATIPFVALFASPLEVPSFATELLVLGLTAVYFWRVWVHIAWVRQHRESVA